MTKTDRQTQLERLAEEVYSAAARLHSSVLLEHEADLLQAGICAVEDALEALQEAVSEESER